MKCLLFIKPITFLSLLLCIVSAPALADETVNRTADKTTDTTRIAKVAVASNFKGAMQAVVDVFEEQSGYQVLLSFGSTGKHYAQIKHGAPFDAFFAADTKRPALLEKEGVASPGSRFTYAIGKLVLWSPDKQLVDQKGEALAQNQFSHLAIANPKLAPYGLAAKQVLEHKKQWQPLRRKMVRGENIGQTYQFVKSGNAQLGFVAYAQVKRPGQTVSGSYWLIPQALYTPIQQQAVLISDNPVADALLSFMKSEQARAIISGYGYGHPDAK